MKRLFVVNGLFGFLNCMSARFVGLHDDITVLVLFSTNAKENVDLERKMRSLASIGECYFLTDPSEYIDKFSDQEFMSNLCSDPDEVRMFFTHNTWLHNRVFSAYPKADLVLYEEGLASYYPGLLDKYADVSRISGVYLQNYLDCYVSPDARKFSGKFGVLDRRRFMELLGRVSSPPEQQILTPDCVVVVEQYLYKKGNAQCIEDAAAEYSEAIRSIIDRGYRVVYKRHPRESTRLYDMIIANLDEQYTSRLSDFPESGRLLEEVLLHQRPAAIVAISSTSLLTVPHYFEIPAFIIRSVAPYEVAKRVAVERRGLVVNQVALTSRIPAVDDLPSVLHGGKAMNAFRGRFNKCPKLCDDASVLALGEFDFDSEFVEIVRKIADPKIRAVSFDLFDTLVKRPAIHASDIFSLLDQALAEHMPKFVRFSDVRSTAFRRLGAEMERRGGRPPEYSLDQIYDYVGDVLGLDLETRALLLEAEVQLESDLVQVRRTGFALTQVVEAYEKPWAITTDTYFNEEQLDRVALTKLPAAPQRVVSSLREQKTKAVGDLFAVTVDTFCLPEHAILHIGDRIDHDVSNAERAGLESAWFPSATTAAESHSRLAAVWNGVREERASALLRGMLFGELFDNPFRSFTADSTCGGSPATLGYLAVGPALIGWASWILRTAGSRGLDSLLFLSRDGFLPFEICQRLVSDSAFKKHPRMSYVMSSRRAMFTLFNQQRGHVGFTEFVHGLSPNSTVRTLLTTRFGSRVAAELGPTVAAAGPGSMDVKIGKKADQVKNALSQVSDTITEMCSGDDGAARDYYLDAVGDSMRPAIVDVGYSGSAQRGISLALDCNISGLYFTTMEHNLEHAVINGLEVDEFVTDPVFFRSGGLLEYLITPPGLESCNGFDSESGKPTFSDPDEQDSLRDDIHLGVRQSIEDFFRIFGGYTAQFVMRPRLATHTLASFMSNPSPADAASLMGGKHENIVAGDADDLFGYWKEGRRALQTEAGPSVTFAPEKSEERKVNGAERNDDEVSPRTVIGDVSALAARIGHGVGWRARRLRKRLSVLR